LYACVYDPSAADAPASAASLVSIAQAYSPRYERHHDGLVSMDISGLERLLGPPRAIADEIGRDALARGLRMHVAVARTCTAAIVLARSRPGPTTIESGQEAAALASIRIEQLDAVIHALSACVRREAREEQSAGERESGSSHVAVVLRSWGLRTLGEVAALPPADLAARLGQRGVLWQAIARGEDIRPLVPDAPEERFESALDLEWPVEGLEPLSFVLTRLLEPLATRLERRDRGAAVLHVMLRQVAPRSECPSGSDQPIHTRRLVLPSPVRDPRTLRTLALLDLESHPPAAPVDRVMVVIDPTPGRVWQHTLFARAHPTPEQLSTLLARLGALMGQDRIGRPGSVDSYQAGAFVMKPFEVDRSQEPARARGPVEGGRASGARGASGACGDEARLASALHRCRPPVPARVVVENGRPVRVTTDRRGFAGGRVMACAGPWRLSGAWWAPPMAPAAGGRYQAGRCGQNPGGLDRPWNRDEWDVTLGDGAVYRIVQDRAASRWFIDAIVD
jgi:protein ImuB